MKPNRFKFPFPKTVRAFVSTVEHDFILPTDAKGLSAKQKQNLKKFYDIDTQKVFTIRQVHGKTVIKVSLENIPQKSTVPEADAVITDVPGIVLTVRTADCLPVLLYDPVQKCVAAVHAGWKGTALAISAETLEAMVNNFGTKPKDVIVFFGPAIQPCCYEVGPEFKETFSEGISKRKNILCLNIPLINKKQLTGLGVKPRNIHDSKTCTVCGKDFFSFRRDKEKAGRHLTGIMIREA